jgi:NADH-quinone oxidoreductase subunit G
LPYDTLDAVRARLVEVNPVFGVLDALPRFGANDTTGPFAEGTIGSAPFAPVVANYYMTDPISRASATMAACTEAHAPASAIAAE